MRRPRVGFLGVGWIGRHRMQALIESTLTEPVAICEPDDTAAAAAMELAPAAVRTVDLEALLQQDLDGLVIATPSALHAGQAIAALQAGCAVFCQKPIGRTAFEVSDVLMAARQSNRLLAVDLSYRFTEAMRQVRNSVQSGALGRIFAVDLVFHNAYGPDKAWFRDPILSGGGCVMDLGVHLIDLAQWTLGFEDIRSVTASLFAAGVLLSTKPSEVEDYCVATLETVSGVVIRVACSWNLPAGRDAIIGASFYGTQGTSVMQNIDGSFFDFAAERTQGSNHRVSIAVPPDQWGGRAILHWANELICNPGFNSTADQLLAVATVIDRIYGRSPPTSS
ncbi:Gfo/Idh/MocA family protein [Acidisphaera sp. L21]|uniref:Gfo/Idh/MocA family protein n=1 Tax=Acidisphaera sp. L21 TaxID=1641851 RepID=UPI00131B381D|nr:Gfo/Idh/MocA family oxidoreductase [Acidisphaera sp. L21]